ncbi:MAG: hypothetical protein QXJ48_02275 [Candidatus Korarchaeum sp.]
MRPGILYLMVLTVLSLASICISTTPVMPPLLELSYPLLPQLSVPLVIILLFRRRTLRG